MRSMGIFCWPYQGGELIRTLKASLLARIRVGCSSLPCKVNVLEAEEWSDFTAPQSSGSAFSALSALLCTKAVRHSAFKPFFPHDVSHFHSNWLPSAPAHSIRVLRAGQRVLQRCRLTTTGLRPSVHLQASCRAGGDCVVSITSSLKKLANSF